MKKQEFEKLESRISTVQFRFNLLILVFIVLVAANFGFFAFLQYRLNEINPETETTNVSQVAIAPVLKRRFQNSINSFYNNTSVSEVGYQLELKKQSVSTKNTTNCFTDNEAPPLKNGCGFVLRPYASGIKPAGSLLISLNFAGEMGGDDRIQVDIKNTDKNEISAPIGVVSGKDKDRRVVLPPTLKPNEQLQIRLWPARGSSITIDEMIIENFSFDMLQTAKLTISDDLLLAFKGKAANIYFDTDKNDLFDDKIDKLWRCDANFPGVKPVTIGKTFDLLRDDSCVSNGYLPAWKSDSFLTALPQYNYLLVVDEDNGLQTTFPLEIIEGKTEYEIT